MVSKALDSLGRIDILVNNVGGGAAAEVDDKDNPLAEVESIWDGTYEMSLKAPVLMCEAVMPHFIEQRSVRSLTCRPLQAGPGCHTSTLCYYQQVITARRQD